MRGKNKILLAVISVTGFVLAVGLAQPETVTTEKSEVIKRTEDKLSKIILSVSFDEIVLERVVEYLARVTAEVDTLETESHLKGINLIIREEKVAKRNLKTLRMEKRPVGEILEQVAELTNTKLHSTDYGVVLEDKNSDLSDENSATRKEGARHGKTLEKLDGIMIMSCAFEDTMLLEARGFFAAHASQKYEGKNAIRFLVPSEEIAGTKIHSLKLRNVTLLALIEAVSSMLGVQYEVEENLVRFVPIATKRGAR